MKALFIVFHGFAKYNGISKKILFQIKAFNDLGVEMELFYLSMDENGKQARVISDIIIKDYGNGFYAKILKRIEFRSIAKYVLDNDIKYVYIRYDHNANPFMIDMLRRIRLAGAWIDMEIPTYPYDNEYIGLGYKEKLTHFIEKIYRRELSKYINRMITFSDAESIYGINTLRISNGIDFSSVKQKSKLSNNIKVLNLIGVADLHFWHGFDRVAKGMVNYYSEKQDITVFFHIVGGGYESEKQKIKDIAKEGKIENYIIFYGPKSGEDLDEIFEIADFGIASLGRHRSGITKIKTLKNREYAARGIPFIYSEIDEDFENMPYIIKAPANEDPIDITNIVDFTKDWRFTPGEIRSSISETLSWKVQMQKIVKILF